MTDLNSDEYDCQWQQLQSVTSSDLLHWLVTSHQFCLCRLIAVERRMSCLVSERGFAGVADNVSDGSRNEK